MSHATPAARSSSTSRSSAGTASALSRASSSTTSCSSRPSECARSASRRCESAAPTSPMVRWRQKKSTYSRAPSRRHSREKHFSYDTHAIPSGSDDSRECTPHVVLLRNRPAAVDCTRPPPRARRPRWCAASRRPARARRCRRTCRTVGRAAARRGGAPRMRPSGRRGEERDGGDAELGGEGAVAIAMLCNAAWRAAAWRVRRRRATTTTTPLTCTHFTAVLARPVARAVERCEQSMPRCCAAAAALASLATKGQQRSCARHHTAARPGAQ